MKILLKSLIQSFLAVVGCAIILYILGIIFSPTVGLVYLFFLMPPLMLMYNLHLGELATASNGFLVPTTQGEIAIAIFYWFIFFIIALVQEMFKASKEQNNRRW